MAATTAQADVMLAELNDWTGQRRNLPEQARPETDHQQFIAMARRDPAGRTISFILDEATANVAIHAIAVSAADREAHMREVEHYGESLPEGSYGRRNRQAIATRESGIAARLRAIEGAYRTTLDHDAAPPLKPAELTAFAAAPPDRELELE